jgi:hypothetical protein
MISQAEIDGASTNLIMALMADPEVAMWCANEIRASDFVRPEHREIWEAARLATNAGESADGPALLRYGAPKAELVALLNNPTTSLHWKQARDVLVRARRNNALRQRISEASTCLDRGDLNGAKMVLNRDDDEVLPGGLNPPETARALCENPPEAPPQIIEGVLFGSGTMMLSGPSKARKTFTFLDAAICISHGVPWLGFRTKKATTLYLNFELSRHSISSRITAIASARGLQAPENLYVQNLRGRFVTTSDLRRRLTYWISRHHVEVVFIDPWYKISAVSGADENSNHGQAQILAEVESICNQAGAAVIIGHHFAKGNASSRNAIDRASGAGAMARWGDVVATLSEHEEDGAMVLEMALRDFKPIEPIGLRWDYPVWERDDDLNTSKLKSARGRREMHPASALLAKLKDGMTTSQWRAAAKWSERTFDRKRKELIQSGRVIEEMGRHNRAPP